MTRKKAIQVGAWWVIGIAFVPAAILSLPFFGLIFVLETLEEKGYL